MVGCIERRHDSYVCELDMKQVHILVREGPEWNDIIDVFSDKTAAQTEADAKNKAISLATPATGRRDLTERLSKYKVVTKKVR